MSRLKEADILIWLNSLGVTNKTIDILLNTFSDIRHILEVEESFLYGIKGIKEKDLGKIIRSRKISEIDKISHKLQEENISTITILDSEYPESLKHIYNKPYVLYKKGSFLETDSLAIGIVGSRKATPYGRWACEKFAKELANMGVTIISGLALGIDAVAHKATIEENGRTIAILGNGLDQVYPKRNERLYKEVEENGALISEFPLGMPPLAYNFPRRNRIIAGLSLGIIVIEAEKKSGSLITAHHALEQGKDVFALPGNINSIYSQGTNRLIRDGARPLLEIDDILEEIKILQDKISIQEKDRLNLDGLSKTEQDIVATLKEGPIHSDLIAHKTGLEISTVIGALTILEMKGIVKELNNGIFTLSQ